MPPDPLNDANTVDLLAQRLDEMDCGDSGESGTQPVVNQDRLVLVSDTDRVIAWWRISSAGIARARAAASTEHQADLILRLYIDGTGRQKRTMDIELERWSGQHPIPLTRQVRQITAAIGYRTGDSFAHIVRAIPVLRTTGGADAGQRRWSQVDWATGQVTRKRHHAFRVEYTISEFVCIRGERNDIRDGLLEGTI